MQRWFIGVGTVVATAALATAWTSPVTAQDPAAGSKIGFVNVKQVLDDYKRTEHEQDRLRKRRDSLQGKIDRMASQLSELQEKLELLVTGSAKHEETKREILKLEQDMKFEREWSNYRIGAAYAKATIEVYKKMLEAVQRYATANGYSLVLKIEGEDIKSDSLVEVNVRINGRAVLFHDTKHDITADVVKALNDEWAKVGPKDPPTDEGGADGGSATGDDGNGGAGGAAGENPK